MSLKFCLENCITKEKNVRVYYIIKSHFVIYSRATEANDLDLYRLIEDIYRDGRATSRNTSWLADLHRDIRVDQLYTKLGHRKEDFIVRLYVLFFLVRLLVC